MITLAGILLGLVVWTIASKSGEIKEQMTLRQKKQFELEVEILKPYNKEGTYE